MLPTTRLNSGTRRHIFEAVMKHRFDAGINMLRQDYASMAQQIYERTFTVEQIMLLASLPEGWCEDKTGLDLYISGHHHWLTFSGAIYWERHTSVREYDHAYYSDKERRPMPHAYSALKIGPSDQLAKEFARLEHRKTTLQEEFGQVKKQVEIMLKSYTTVGTLLAAWPEVQPFLPSKQVTTVATAANLPAISIPSLNILLRLPVTVKDAADFAEKQKATLTCI